MGTMNRMRENTGVVLWILVLSFGGLWVLQDSGVFDTIGTNPLGKVIVVNGDAITAEVYQNQLNAQLEQYRQRTGGEVEPQQLESERERAFNILVEDKLREHAMDRLGITVSDKEVQELITGSDPHAIIKAYFPDQQGGVDRTLLQNVIDDPDQETTWIQLEEYIRVDRRRQKFENLIGSTVRVSEEDILAEYRQTITQATADFFFLRYAAVPNDSVELSDRDLQRFYDERREDFKKERLYSIELASLSKLPAQDDSLGIFREVERLRPEFEATDNDSLFLASKASERPYTDAFFAAGDIDPEIATLIFEGEESIEAGTIIGPVVVGEQVHLIKVMETRPVEETNVRARHILVRATEGDAAAVASARQKIQEIRQRIEGGEDFAAVARETSEDTGSGARGGDLGWFGPGSMVEPFQNAAFGAQVGRLVGPVETQFGVHLIEVTNRAEVDVRLADLAQTLEASVATLNAIQDKLDDLKFYTEETGDFAGEAERRDIPLQTLQIQQDQVAIPTFGTSRALARFLETAEVDDVSPVIELNDFSILVRVVEIEPEGYRPLAEVENEMRPRALLEKKKELQRQRMEQAYNQGGFDGLANALTLTSRTANNLSFSNQLVPGLGRDPVFAGTVLGLAVGEDSGVTEGANGVFVARVTNIVEPPPISDAERERLRNQLYSRQKNLVQTRWITSLREQADIQDLRVDVLQQ